MGTARAAHLPRAVPSAEIVASPQQGHHFVTANNGSWNAQRSAHKAACSVSMFIAIKVIQISKVIVVRKIYIFCIIWKSLGHLKYPSNKTLKNLLHRFLSPPPHSPFQHRMYIYIQLMQSAISKTYSPSFSVQKNTTCCCSPSSGPYWHNNGLASQNMRAMWWYTKQLHGRQGKMEGRENKGKPSGEGNAERNSAQQYNTPTLK